MKKLSSKFIASAVISALMAAAVAVSASAVDYVVVPTYTPPSTGTSTGSGDTSGSSDDGSSDDGNKDDEKSDESTGDAVIGDKEVEDAIKNGEDVDVVVDDNGDAVASEAAIGAIATGDTPVTFDMADDGSDIDYTITIDPATITTVQSINLAMDVAVVESPVGAAISITPAQKGDFGMTLVVTIPASAFGEMDVDKLALYYIDDEGNVSLVPGGITVNADGSVSVAISHASSYLITDVDVSAIIGGETGIDDDDDDDDDDVIIGDDDDDTVGKDDTVVVNPGASEGTDSNPVTGTTLALGSLAVFAAAAVATSKKRK